MCETWRARYDAVDRTLFVVLGERGQLRRPLHQRIVIESELEKRHDLSAGDPIRTSRYVPRPLSTGTMQLASLNGEVDLGCAAIAGHNLELGAVQRIEQRRHDVGQRQYSRRAEVCLVLCHIGNGLDRRLVGYRDHAVHRGHVADPLDLRHVETNAFRKDLLVKREYLKRDSDDRAVLRRNPVDVGGRRSRRGPYPVLNDDLWAARNVFWQVAGKQAGVDVVAAAGCKPNDE